ncbi:50S ribosomal protein L4 [soil metagenome]
MASKKMTTEKSVEEKIVTKKIAPKKVVKTDTVEAAVASSKPMKTTSKTGNVSVEVLDINGKVVETLSLSSEMFGSAINTTLMAQAVRVYLANQRQGTLRTKSRGEVRGSTRKIYRQKGTGRARHGGIRAPIFVGGGVAHGPKPRDYSMSFPKKMKRIALFSALSSKVNDNELKIVSGFEKVGAKTKDMAVVMKALGLTNKKQSVLMLTDNTVSVTRAIRNLEGIRLLPAIQANTYEILQAKTVMIMKEALEILEKNFSPKE